MYMYICKLGKNNLVNTYFGLNIYMYVNYEFQETKLDIYLDFYPEYRTVSSDISDIKQIDIYLDIMYCVFVSCLDR